MKHILFSDYYHILQTPLTPEQIEHRLSSHIQPIGMRWKAFWKGTSKSYEGYATQANFSYKKVHKSYYAIQGTLKSEKAHTQIHISIGLLSHIKWLMSIFLTLGLLGIAIIRHCI